ncbi:hypothetical protein CDAR_556251 [Caerostris darwini]|uniref:Uncharacterized protein n=1 Tax=Caerostris darwini TaxID=1538125 RepID=A0AAV4MBH7_9ARAC|nr:hypothetical protein CDAR_556251 [Caerostris darwini]
MLEPFQMHFRDYIVSHSRREQINCAHLLPLMDQLGTQLPPEAPGVVHRELLLPQHICPQSTATSTPLRDIFQTVLLRYSRYRRGRTEFVMLKQMNEPLITA